MITDKKKEIISRERLICVVLVSYQHCFYFSYLCSRATVYRAFVDDTTNVRGIIILRSSESLTTCISLSSIFQNLLKLC